jgi:hypothetical protein
MSLLLDKIVSHLENTQSLNNHIADNGLTQVVHNLQSWQTQRLLASHDDLWQTKRFKPAMQFFIDELYGPKDFSQRDAELAKIVPKMAKVLPEKGLVSLEAALRLNSLSLQLDLALIDQLKDDALNSDTYFRAYRACDNQSQRGEQIQLLEDLGLDLAQVVKITGISTILMLSRKPAQVAGVSSLHEFLENGFKAFKKLGKVEDFINPIVSKERLMMVQLFHNDIDDNPLPTL